MISGRTPASQSVCVVFFRNVLTSVFYCFMTVHHVLLIYYQEILVILAGAEKLPMMLCFFSVIHVILYENAVELICWGLRC